VLLASFVVAVAINLARGRELDCGCFGRGKTRPIDHRLLLQNLALLAMGVLVAVRGHGWATPEPLSIFRLTGQEASFAPLLGCVLLTVGATVLLPMWNGHRPLAGGRWRAASRTLKGGVV
jgi:hypothetical protein